MLLWHFCFWYFPCTLPVFCLLLYLWAIRFCWNFPFIIIVFSLIWIAFVSINNFQHLSLHCRMMMLRFMIMILINTGKHFLFQMILLLNTAGGILKSWRLIHQDLENWQLLWATLVGLMTKRRWLSFHRSLISIFFCSSSLNYFFLLVVAPYVAFWSFHSSFFGVRERLFVSWLRKVLVLFQDQVLIY